MIKYFIYIGLALATLISPVSAHTLLDQTSQNIQITATDYKDCPNTVVIEDWKAADFYTYGMNPVTVTITNHGTQDITISGKALRNSNEAGIVDAPTMKPWYMKTITWGLELCTDAPYLYAMSQGALKNNLSLLIFCAIPAIWFSGTVYPIVPCFILLADYLPQNKIRRYGVAAVIGAVHALNHIWRGAMHLTTQQWNRHIFMV